MMSPSLLFFAYNHEAFVEAALVSAIRQDIQGYELIIVDDASTDRTRTIIQEVLARENTSGLKVVTLFHERNLGLLAAVNSGMALATGKIFVMMAGDDISRPDRLRRTIAILDKNPNVQLVYGEVEIIDSEGKILRPAPEDGVPKCVDYARGPFGRVYAGALPCGASAAYRRNLYDVFGPMRPGSHAEDNCYWIRALLLGAIYHDPACYIQWRRHSANLSNFAVSSGDEWRERHVASMLRHAGMSGQWLADLEKARSLGLVSWWLEFRVRHAVRREVVTWALGCSSLRPDPWNKWWGLAWEMLKAGRLSTIFKMLNLRLFRSRREKAWRDLAKLQSSGHG